MGQAEELRALRYRRGPKHLTPCDLPGDCTEISGKGAGGNFARPHPGQLGEEGKWFATAKEAGLLDLAIELANRSPSDPRTLTRAARDFMEKNPAFALEAGLAALRWLGQGYGYEITRADVWRTNSRTIQVAERLGRRDEIRARVRELVPSAGFVADVLGRELGPRVQPGTSKKS
jgi:hypothetical protein